MREHWLPQYEDAGRFWTLSLTETGLRFIVCPDLAAECRQLEPNPQHLSALQKELGLPEFIAPKEGDWGFGPWLKWAEGMGTDGRTWPALQFEWPQPTSIEEAHRQTEALSASLHLLQLTLWLWYKPPIDELMAVPPYQLLQWDGWCLGRERRPGTWALGFAVTPASRRAIDKVWKEKSQDKMAAVVAERMREVMRRLAPRLVRLGDNSIGLRWLTPPRFFLQTFGNAADLGPDGSFTQHDDEGFELGPHNIDSALQQLSLLAGVAAVHDYLLPFSER